MTTVLIVLGGGLGAVLRYVADGALRGRLSVWATAAINVSGSFVLGVLAGAVAGGGLGGTALAVLGTGVCGGYTTFSTATIETLTLLRDKRYRDGVVYGLSTLVASVVAVWSGYALGAL
ncbi:CrcB family protein [Tsukamurella asaccharolytica]|uniref:Fluoride-specific ion channel FluC n=1 Tax=Tsukamurella asaccharolytica TaxID=2592067 RepID=A0A5C5RE31_9ACTN|nr:CrcB family protein [Tsukamurella asaccharolytica]TWS20693.1 CrcB family protein [Tsukamurella asaccharolytica]